jgi:rubrerythrin
MNFKTIKEVLQFAILKEEASYKLYRELAEIMKDERTKLIFEGLNKNELQHRNNLEFELIKHGHTVDDTAFEFSDTEKAYLDADDQFREMTYVDALKMAIRKERAAFRLYSELMVQTRNPEFHDLFFELAQEEMRHVIQFEDEYNNVMNRKQ